MTTAAPPSTLVLDRRALRKARLLAGLTQATLAESAGVHTISVVRYETGHMNPRPGTIARLAAALGLTVADLADVED